MMQPQKQATSLPWSHRSPGQRSSGRASGSLAIGGAISPLGALTGDGGGLTGFDFRVIVPSYYGAIAPLAHNGELILISPLMHKAQHVKLLGVQGLYVLLVQIHWTIRGD